MADTTSSDVLLDFSILEDEEETYSSLTDIHNVPLFTNDFSNRIVYKGREAEEKNKIIEDVIFIEEIAVSDVDKTLLDSLFLVETSSVVKRDLIEEETKEYEMPIMISAVCIFAVVMGIYIRYRNKKIERISKGGEDGNNN
ncbi:MAG: hypothetical protein ACK5LL_07330 [Suipraeoptans sp.]